MSLFSIRDVTIHISDHLSMIYCCVTHQLKTATTVSVYPSVVWLGLCWAVLLFVSIEVSHVDAVRWLCSQVWCPSGDSWEAVTFCSFTFYVASLGFFSWWSCSVVGVPVCQILDPPAALARKGNRRGHQEARLQTSGYWVRIWFVSPKVICSNRGT